jgi:hypothetical protein
VSGLCLPARSISSSDQSEPRAVHWLSVPELHPACMCTSMPSKSMAEKLQPHYHNWSSHTVSASSCLSPCIHIQLHQGLYGDRHRVRGLRVPAFLFSSTSTRARAREASWRSVHVSDRYFVEQHYEVQGFCRSMRASGLRLSSVPWLLSSRALTVRGNTTQSIQRGA